MSDDLGILKSFLFWIFNGYLCIFKKILLFLSS